MQPGQAAGCHRQSSFWHCLSTPLAWYPRLSLRAHQRRAARRWEGARSLSQEDSQHYIGTDGRRKYTWEEVFRSQDGGDAAIGDAGSAPPWNMGWQASEKRLNLTEDLRMRLQQRLVSQRLDVSEEEARERLVKLRTLMPDSHERLLTMNVELVARMAGNLAEVAARLVALKASFPTADIAQMISRQPMLVAGDAFRDIEQAGAKLTAILPGVEVDRLVERHPSVLDTTSFEQAVGEARRMMPNLDIAHTVSTNPDIIFSFQRGSNLIPYDGVDDPPD